MAKPELGTKRLCGSCSAKFYDLSKNPIVCPKCHTVMELAAAARARRGRSRAAVARRAAAPVAEETWCRRRRTPSSFRSRTPTPRRRARRPRMPTPRPTDDDIEIDESLDDAALIEETGRDRRGRHRHHRRARGRGGALSRRSVVSRSAIGGTAILGSRFAASDHCVPDGAIAQLGERLNGIQKPGVLRSIAAPFKAHLTLCEISIYAGHREAGHCRSSHVLTAPKQCQISDFLMLAF